ncbi:hypothetical protein KCU73_g14964, partial [Aureobasidium melanogenum]
AHEAAPPVLPPSSPLVQSPINARDYRPTHYSRQLAAGAAPPTKETRQAAQESPQHTTDSRQPAEETHRHTADSRRAVNRKESPHHARQAEARVQPLGDSAQPFEDLNQPGEEPPQHTDDLDHQASQQANDGLSVPRNQELESDEEDDTPIMQPRQRRKRRLQPDSDSEGQESESDQHSKPNRETSITASTSGTPASIPLTSASTDVPAPTARANNSPASTKPIDRRTTNDFASTATV